VSPESPLSHLFDSPLPEVRHWRPVPYVRIGNLRRAGYNEVLSKSRELDGKRPGRKEEMSELQLPMEFAVAVARFNDLISDSPARYHRALMKEWIHNHVELLRTVPAGCSWWASREAGGLGLIPPPGFNPLVDSLTDSGRPEVSDFSAACHLLTLVRPSFYEDVRARPGKFPYSLVSDQVHTDTFRVPINDPILRSWQSEGRSVKDWLLLHYYTVGPKMEESSKAFSVASWNAVWARHRAHTTRIMMSGTDPSAFSLKQEVIRQITEFCQSDPVPFVGMDCLDPHLLDLAPPFLEATGSGDEQHRGRSEIFDPQYRFRSMQWSALRPPQLYVHAAISSVTAQEAFPVPSDPAGLLTEAFAPSLREILEASPPPLQRVPYCSACLYRQLAVPAPLPHTSLTLCVSATGILPTCSPRGDSRDCALGGIQTVGK
jgi:hypothetical protein